MGFLGIEATKAPAGMRSKRVLAFLIDAAVAAALPYAVYRATGQPDFFAVRAAMDAAGAAGGQDQALTTAVLSSSIRRTAYCCSLRFAMRRWPSFSPTAPRPGSC